MPSLNDSESPMSPAERKDLMAINRVKAKRIAFLCDVSETAVSLVISGFSRSRKIEEAIAMACGKYRDDMFPPNAREAAHFGADMAAA